MSQLVFLFLPFFLGEGLFDLPDDFVQDSFPLLTVEDPCIPHQSLDFAHILHIYSKPFHHFQESWRNTEIDEVLPEWAEQVGLPWFDQGKESGLFSRPSQGIQVAHEALKVQEFRVDQGKPRENEEVRAQRVIESKHFEVLVQNRIYVLRKLLGRLRLQLYDSIHDFNQFSAHVVISQVIKSQLRDNERHSTLF